MKTLLPLCCAVLLLGCSTTRNSVSNTTEEQVRRVLADILDSAEKKDFARLDNHHWYGAHFTKFASSGTRLDAQQAREGEHKGLGGLTGLKLQTEDMKVDLFRDSAVATFTMAATFQSSEGMVTKRERGTLVFVRHDGDWKIVHEHFSPTL
jgi:ketosteroid isomerase-like protein